MCGILGAFSSTRNLAIALDSLTHRGPDAAGVWSDGRNYLGHRRLSIVDVAGGKQPLVNETKDIVAVVNGEFYGTTELPGHTYATKSDSEALIHLYEEYGVKCLEHLRGEFAFILFDRRRKLVFAARDRFGIRPLNYAQYRGGLYLASEAKALLAAGIPAQLNRHAVHFAMHLQYLPIGETLFEGINMLPPGHYLTFEDGKVQLTPYWTTPWSEGWGTDDLGAIVEDAVRLRIPSEVPFCCHLSGGLDSSIVAAVASNAVDRPIDHFTVQFVDDESYDETAIAQRTADFLGDRLHVVPVTAADMLNATEAAVRHAEGLAINGHLGAKWLLNQRIHEMGFKVALTGEGSDELFLGYEHLRNDEGAAFTATASGGTHLPTGDTLDTTEIRIQLGFVPTWIQAKASLGARISHLWADGFGAEFSSPFGRMIPCNAPEASRAKVSSWLWTYYCLSGYILRTLDDAQGMAHAVESRLPFLDTKVAQAAANHPTSFLMEGQMEKTLLRKHFAGILPAEVVNNPKKPFSAPPTNPPAERILDSKMMNSGIFSRHAVEKWLDKRQQTPADEAVGMTLFTLAIFHDTFL